jgi:16S rRNA (guanine527-N7)-methyltransferase
MTISDMNNLIDKYFPGLSEEQQRQFAALDELYHDWNAKINVISRKDIDNLYEHHVLHSLAIAKKFPFPDGLKVLDVGTGGGFPGIPLAILYPQVQFKLIDSIGKKIRVASEVAQAIHLTNVVCQQERAEEEKGKYDCIVSRAVMPMHDFLKLVRKNATKKEKAIGELPSGVICLKGGELDEELKSLKYYIVYDLKSVFEEEYFQTKKVVYVSLF